MVESLQLFSCGMMAGPYQGCQRFRLVRAVYKMLVPHDAFLHVHKLVMEGFYMVVIHV